MAAYTNFYKSISTIYMALIVGLLTFCAVIIFATGALNQTDETKADPYMYVFIPLSFFMVGASFFIQSKLLAGVSELSFESKLDKWRTALLVRAAMLEGPCLINIIGLFLTGKYLYLYLFVAILAIMIFTKPTKDKIKDDLDLTEEQLALL